MFDHPCSCICSEPICVVGFKGRLLLIDSAFCLSGMWTDHFLFETIVLSEQSRNMLITLLFDWSSSPVILKPFVRVSMFALCAVIVFPYKWREGLDGGCLELTCRWLLDNILSAVYITIFFAFSHKPFSWTTLCRRLFNSRSL